MIRNRYENLCVSYVDSETKSGASTAREVAELLRPGKCAGATDVGAWLQSHVDQDAVLVIVDDFAGSGQTMVKGLARFTQQEAAAAAFRKFREAGRIHVVVLFAFPEAVGEIRKQFPEFKVTAIRVFGDEVRALEPEAGIFSDEGEQRFARDILRQIGQQLVPQHPLGHADSWWPCPLPQHGAEQHAADLLVQRGRQRATLAAAVPAGVLELMT